MGLGDRQARYFFLLDIGYLVLLVALVVIYKTGIFGYDPSSDFPNNTIAGVLPLAVPWFGALGGVTISLYGIFDHNQGWNPKWNYWHAARPFVGGILAVVGYFAFVGAIQSTNTQVQTSPKGTGAIVYYVLAFVLGFREETFRELIKRFVDLILSPGGTDGSGPRPSLTADPMSGAPPLAVHFSAAESSATNAETMQFTLDYGDGANPIEGTGIPVGLPAHSYETPGQYQASLWLMDGNHQLASTTVRIGVIDPGAGQSWWSRVWRWLRRG